MISAAFQSAAPTKVKARNFPCVICARPAGSEIIVRRNGEKRSAKTTHWPWLRKKRLAFSMSSHSIVSQRPQRSTSGCSRS